MASLRQGDVLASLPYNPPQVGRVRLSPYESSKALVLGSGRGGAGRTP